MSSFYSSKIPEYNANKTVIDTKLSIQTWEAATSKSNGLFVVGLTLRYFSYFNLYIFFIFFCSSSFSAPFLLSLFFFDAWADRLCRPRSNDIRKKSKVYFRYFDLIPKLISFGILSLLWYLLTFLTVWSSCWLT